MKKQIFIDGEYQYDYEVSGKLHRLLFCDTEFWSDTTRGTVAFELLDDGNGMNIMSLFDKNNIDYTQAEQLQILLRLLDQGTVYEVSTKKIL
jgi:hypothetical protein